MVGHGLRSHLRGLRAAGRPHRRPPWSAAHAHGRPGHLHRRLARGRARILGHLPDRDAGYPGLRCRARAPGRALDRDEHVPRRHRAQQGTRDLGRCRCLGGHRGALRRGHPDHLRRMAVHLLFQRSHRSLRLDHGPEGGARKPQPGRSPALRPVRRVSITAALLVYVYAVSEAPQVGWASPWTIGLLGVGTALLVWLLARRIQGASAAPAACVCFG